MDVHTHFLRDDTKLAGFARMREAVRQGRLESRAGPVKPQTVDDLKYPKLVQGDLTSTVIPRWR